MTVASYLDSHCHLQEPHLTPHLDSFLEKAEESNVARMLCNATHEQDWQAVLDLATDKPGIIIPFLGIHPWFAETATVKWEVRLLDLLQQIPAGIGETGLDKCCRSDFARQQQIFLIQLQMASEFRRPLVIHCVKAWGKLLEILEQFPHPLPPTMIHSFSGSNETRQRLIRLGCFISYSCRIITDSRLQSSLVKTPLTNLLLETDAPAPPGSAHTPCREPAAVTGLYELAASLRRIPLNEFRQEIWRNGEIFTDTILPR